MSTQIYCAKKMIVTVPVADIRTGPGAAPEEIVGPALSQDSRTPNSNITQDSQVLMHEIVIAEQDATTPHDWYKVHMIMQPEFAQGNWQHCSGFISAHQVTPAPCDFCINAVVAIPWADILQNSTDDAVIQKLSLGTCLSLAPENPNNNTMYSSTLLATGQKGFIKNDSCYMLDAVVQEHSDPLRARVVQTLLSFLASPYVWGGCSAFDATNKHQLTGIDCSSLIYLTMRAHGLLIPRNAHDQYLVSSAVSSGKDLKPGDVVYLCRKGQTRMNHVLAFLGNETFIEATGLSFSSVRQAPDPKALTTRVVSAHEFFGFEVGQLTNNLEFILPSGPHTMHLRTFLGNSQQVQELRDNFLSALQ